MVIKEGVTVGVTWYRSLAFVNGADMLDNVIGVILKWQILAALIKTETKSFYAFRVFISFKETVSKMDVFRSPPIRAYLFNL